MLPKPPNPLDPKLIAECADMVKKTEDRVAALRESAKQAAQELSAAECDLSNARIRFTRAVDGHLAIDDLNQKSSRVNV